MHWNNPKVRRMSILLSLGALIALGLLIFAPVFGQFSRVLITQAIDESKLVTLRGNTRPEARIAQNDRGLVSDGFPMDYMLLQLKRPAALESELKAYIEQLTDKSSPNFHKWLTPEQIADRYGMDQQDLSTITGWLSSHGFTVDHIYPATMVVAFSGTAGMIRDAFHTEIHYLEVGGQSHYANMSDPQIPAALAPAVVGVVSMHNFRPHAMYDSVPNYTNGGPCISGNTFSCYNLVPADFQTIYNLNPLYRQGITGTGQTIVVVEDSNTYSNDVALFRSTFLGKYTSGSVTTTHPGSGCSNPGTNAADIEADLDAEIASAIAPNAAIQVATCSDTSTFGGLIAIQNLVNAGSPPAIMSVSYGECESTNNLPSNAAFNTAYQAAAAAGVSVFVSSGDAGSSTCAGNGSPYSTVDIGVNGWGSTPYNVSVGGTDFEDSYNATKGSPTIPLSTYWSSTNTPTNGSAISYIPEIPWNKSCASWLMANYLGYSTTYGSGGYCNSGVTLTTGAAGGGPSGCATGSPANSGYVDGTCAGYAKPSWQQGIFGNPADGVRDLPDVSMFASHGVWGHSMIMCGSDTFNGGSSCSGAISTWKLVGGTSVGTPLLAAIQALVNQKWNTRTGNPNPIYYQIAKAEFGSTGNSACYSINQPPRRGLASNCAFYDITQGDIDVPCSISAGANNCYNSDSSTYGVESTQAVTSVIGSGGSGYTSTPNCTITPNNLTAYLSPTGTTIYGGGTPATCTVTGGGPTFAAGSVKIITNPSGWGTSGTKTVTVGGTTYTFVSSVSTTANQVLWYTASGTASTNENRTAQNLRAAIDATSGQCYASPCFGSLTTANSSATATVSTNTVSLTATTAGTGGNFAVTTNYSTGMTVSATNGSNSSAVTNVTLATGGVGYADGNPICTITGGGGSGATCTAVASDNFNPATYQPAFGATPGWDFATGIGSVNAYNLVYNTAW